MALAPWDLVSWQSLSDTASLCEPLSVAAAGVRRESYLKATRTPTSGGCLDRNDSLRLSRTCSLNMPSSANRSNSLTPLNKTNSSETTTAAAAADKTKGVEKDPPSGISEIFQTPTGEVSLVITDHSTTATVAATNVASAAMTTPAAVINNNSSSKAGKKLWKQSSTVSESDKTSTLTESTVSRTKTPTKLTNLLKLTSESEAEDAAKPKEVKTKDFGANSAEAVGNEDDGPSDDELYVKKKPTKATPSKNPLETVDDENNNERPPYLGRDIFVLCIVFIFAFSAVRAVQVLQSSVNDRGKLGTLALSVFYFSLAATVILLPPIVRGRLSDRTSLCLGIFLLFVWLLANLMPHPIFLLPAAILGGIGLTLAWSAQMNAFASYFSHAVQCQQTDAKVSLRRFLLTNNTLFALFQSSHIWGNLSVAAILLIENRPADPDWPYGEAVTVKIVPATNRSIEYNMTIGPGWYFFPPLFGVDLLPSLSSKYDDLWAKCQLSVENLPKPNHWLNISSTQNFQIAPFPAAWALAWLATLGFLALLIAAIFFHPQPKSNRKRVLPPPVPNADGDDDTDLRAKLAAQLHDTISIRIQKFIVAHMFQLFDGPHFRLLLPLLFFNGLEQGFLYTDYTKVFLSCMFGLSSVGVAVMVAGVMSCLFSAVASFAAKRSVSREIIISVAAIVHLALAAFLYQWQPYPSIPILVIIIPVIYGFCDAVWQTSCYVLITKVAGSDHQLAFSNFRILQSLGIATSCLLSFVAGLGVKVAILVGNLLLAVLCYAILENRIRREELEAKDRERLASAFKQLTMVMGAAGIRSRNLRLPPINRPHNGPSMFGNRTPPSPSMAAKMKLNPNAIGAKAVGPNDDIFENVERIANQIMKQHMLKDGHLEDNIIVNKPIGYGNSPISASKVMKHFDEEEDEIL